MLSMKLSRELDITNKNTWHPAHRIQETFADFEYLIDRMIDLDEKYMDGLKMNKDSDKKLKTNQGSVGKSTVASMKKRDSNQIITKVIKNVRIKTSQRFIQDNTFIGEEVFTDEHKSYLQMHSYNHQFVCYSKSEYVKEQVHVNGNESIWSLAKRTHKGSLHELSRKHLNRYFQKFFGLHNIRSLDTIDKMAEIVSRMVGKRLTCKKLVS